MRGHIVTTVCEIYLRLLQVTGNTSFALSALESLKQECVEEALSDTSLTGTDQGLQAIKNIKESNCINECSGNGHCEKGMLYTINSLLWGQYPRRYRDRRMYV